MELDETRALAPDTDTVEQVPPPDEAPAVATDPGSTREVVVRSLAETVQQSVTVREGGTGSVREDLEGLEDPRHGRRLGRYEISGRLGAGGMGIVYAARDPELDREVALKVLRADVGTVDERARLLREAQAMARLQHANVVAVYDVGPTKGGVFVAMEYVRGTNLRAWLGERARPWQEVLRVFLDAGRGLAAAHAAGLIHRDFKPENVLLSDQGEVKVSDFGLARLGDYDAEETEKLLDPNALYRTDALSVTLTRTGTVLGTPAYMAPEQFLSHTVDARTDQFNFCVALFEALHGGRPFTGATYDELSRNVTSGTRDASGPRRDVPAWVEAVVDRGLQPHPNSRWPGMDELLAALADDPAPRRRRRLAAVGGVVTVTAVVAGVASTRPAAELCTGLDAQLEGIWDDARAREVRDAITGTGLVYAEQTAERVDAALDAYAAAWVDGRVAACEATRIRGDQSEALLDARVRCLEGRRRDLIALVDVLAVGEKAAVGGAVISATRLPSIERCADIEYVAAATPPPDDLEVAAEVERQRERLARARALEGTGAHEQSLAIIEEVRVAAADIDYPPLHVEASFAYGSNLAWDRRLEEAERAQLRAHTGAIAGGEFTLARDTAIELAWLAGVDGARPEEGLRWAQLAKAWLARFPDDRAEARRLSTVGSIYGKQRRVEESFEAMEGAAELLKRISGPESIDVASALNNLAGAYATQGRFEDAIEMWSRAHRIMAKAAGRDHPHVALILGNVALLSRKRGHFEQGLEASREVLELVQRALPADHPRVAMATMNVGINLVFTGALPEAREVLGRVRTMSDKDSADTAVHYLGLIAHREGRFEEAETRLREALAVQEHMYSPDDPRVLNPLCLLTTVLLDAGRRKEALTLAERAAEIATAAEQRPHFQAVARYLLARARIETGTLDAQERAQALTTVSEARAAMVDADADELVQAADIDRWLERQQ